MSKTFGILFGLGLFLSATSAIAEPALSSISPEIDAIVAFSQNIMPPIFIVLYLLSLASACLVLGQQQTIDPNVLFVNGLVILANIMLGLMFGWTQILFWALVFGIIVFGTIFSYWLFFPKLKKPTLDKEAGDRKK